MAAGRADDDTCFGTDTPEWYLATRIGERAATLTEESDGESGGWESQLASLRKRFPYREDDGLFENILRYHGIRDAEFAMLSQESAEDVKARFGVPPDWIRAVASLRVVADPDTDEPNGWQDSGKPGRPAAELLSFVHPLMTPALRRLREGVHAIVGCSDRRLDPVALCDALEGTWPRKAMTRLLLRVLVLEMNIARIRGELRGDSGAERYRDFVAWSSDPSRALRLWKTYPVLLRESQALLDSWVVARLEFCAHLCADVGVITQMLELPGVPVLESVAFDAGDGHRGGRSVGILAFGGGRRIVYKPRSLRIDQHFQDLLRWANDAGFEPRFPLLRSHSTDDHGWSAFVDGSACDDEAQLRSFYRRHGGYLGLLYTLRATDFHHENVIASGEYPYLVDLEALFGAELVVDGASVTDEDVARKLILSTVLSTGLLPSPLIYLDDTRQTKSDVSGISYEPGQKTAVAIPTWEDPVSDTMRIVHRRIEMGGSRNLPILGPVSVNPAGYVEDILTGFEAMYRILMREREALLAADGPLAPFAEDTVRRIFGATQSYSSFLWDSYHPNLLRNALARDMFLDRVFARYGTFVVGPALTASERRQLAQGDVPIFTSTAGGRDLLGGDGSVIEDALEASGLDLVRDRIRALSETDLARQKWVIESAFACARTQDLSASWPVAAVVTHGGPGQPATLLRQAKRIGDELLDTALRTGDEVGWLGIAPAGTDLWRLAPTGPGLYSGTTGIGLFLLYLGAVSGVDRYTAAAGQIARAAARRARLLADLPAPPAEVHALGLTGIVDCGLYFVAHWAALSGDRQTLDAMIADVLPRLSEAVDLSTDMDLVDGVAGSLIGLAAAYAVSPTDQIEKLVLRCVERIAESGRRDGRGISWDTSASDMPLGGVAHGASGIALAALRASSVRGATRCDELIRGALEYEESLFDARLNTWPDLRPGNRGNTMTAWCHGAPGIGIVRMAIDAGDGTGGGESTVADLRRAQRAVTAFYGEEDTITIRNLSLCHGELGNLEFLAEASRRLGDSRCADLSRRLANAAVTAIDEHGLICGVPEGLRTPGLMNGIAGIGFGLLRQSRPDVVPSVLACEPPSAPTVLACEPPSAPLANRNR